MLSDYVTVVAALSVMFTTIIVNTQGWEALRTQKGIETVLLVPILWPVIISVTFLVGLTISIVITFATVYGLVKVDRNSLMVRGRK